MFELKKIYDDYSTYELYIKIDESPAVIFRDNQEPDKTTGELFFLGQTTINKHIQYWVCFYGYEQIVAARIPFDVFIAVIDQYNAIRIPTLTKMQLEDTITIERICYNANPQFYEKGDMNILMEIAYHNETPVFLSSFDDLFEVNI